MFAMPTTEVEREIAGVPCSFEWSKIPAKIAPLFAEGFGTGETEGE